MKNKDVVGKILEYHPQLENYDGCDGYKCGDPEAECTGIAVALVPTAQVLDKAAELGCNLVIGHEPIFYQTPDYPKWRGTFDNFIYREKIRRIEEKGLTVWRDHDHIHAHRPDGIFYGVMRELGWTEYLTGDDGKINYRFELPETTVGDLGRFLKEKLSLNGLRIVGNPDDKVTKVAIVGHLYPNSHIPDVLDENGYYHDYAMNVMQVMEEEGIEVIIPGEIIEWTVLSYIRDASYMGHVRACLNIGHYSLEELGMKDFSKIVKTMVPEDLPVVYIPTQDEFTYI